MGVRSPRLVTVLGVARLAWCLALLSVCYCDWIGWQVCVEPWGSDWLYGAVWLTLSNCVLAAVRCSLSHAVGVVPVPQLLSKLAVELLWERDSCNSADYIRPIRQVCDSAHIGIFLIIGAVVTCHHCNIKLAFRRDPSKFATGELKVIFASMTLDEKLKMTYTTIIHNHPAIATYWRKFYR